MLPNLENKKVLVGMSGGIDSSMAAILLQEAGADVIGVMLKLGEERLQLTSNMSSTKCCNLDDVNDARNISVEYDFPFNLVDLTKEFTKYVIDDYVNNSSVGNTPNPCVMCNKHVKWGSMMEIADKLNCDYVATGHYAKIIEKDGKYSIGTPKDTTKDQTYFLWNLSQNDLSKTLFPLGEYLKEDVKWMAAKRGLTDIVNKSESADICFVDMDGTQDNFLLRKNPDLSKLDGGEFFENDKVVGKHKGHPFYTIGQRRGLGVALGYPVYITRIDPDTNKIYLGRRKDLERNVIVAKDPNYMLNIVDGEEVSVKVRSTGDAINGRIHLKDDGFDVYTSDRFNATAKGQSAVVYKDNMILVGGIIENTKLFS